MSETFYGGGLRRGKTSEWINKVKECLKLGASVYAPVSGKAI